MKQNIVEIFFAGKNFSAHVPLLPGCVSTGKTPDEIKNKIQEAIRGNYELVYKFDTQSLLKYYKNVITGSALEKYSGINQKQLNHYANLHRKPRIEQINKIKLAFHNLGKELMSVEL